MAKKIRMSRKNRVCRIKGCDNVLSVYNNESSCHVHLQTDMIRQVFSPMLARRRG